MICRTSPLYDCINRSTRSAHSVLTLMSVPKGVALITGSAQGIGRSIALRLARDGLHIALNDFPKKGTQLDSVATEVESLGRQVCVVPANVTVNKEVKEMVDGAVTKLGGLDVVCLSSYLTILRLNSLCVQMVANAGVSMMYSFLSCTISTKFNLCLPVKIRRSK